MTDRECQRRGPTVRSGSRRRGARRARPAAAAAAASLLIAGGPAAGADRYRYVTPWFRTDDVPALFEIPHVLRVGDRHRAEVLRDGRWRRVYSGEFSPERVLDGGRAVLVPATAEIYRADTAEVIRLPRAACGGWWRNSVFVPRGQERVVCVRVVKRWACGEIEVAQFDLAGALVRHDVLGRAAFCSAAWGSWDFNTHALGGLTADLDPVVAVRVGPEGEMRIRFAVFALEPGGPKALGQFTTWKVDTGELLSWPEELRSRVVHPAF